MTWCVAHTQPLKEIQAQQNLIDQGFEVYLPRFKKIRRHARRVDEVLTPLFPRYLFVNIDLNSTPWRTINSTRGISYLLMTDDEHPAHIQDEIIFDLKAQEVGDGIVPIKSLITFVKGDTVRIIDGAFKDHAATFDALDDKGRAKLLLTFLGRETTIILPHYSVEEA
jgi:transcriptional antiterminator RfaH